MSRSRWAATMSRGAGATPRPVGANPGVNQGAVIEPLGRLIAFAALLAALLAAAPAEAAPEWHTGTSETSYVLNCNFDQEPGIRRTPSSRPTRRRSRAWARCST